MAETPETTTGDDSLEPPGGMLVWLILIVEVVTFLATLVVFAWLRQQDVEAFNLSQSTLDRGLATLNTIVLITSGYFVALGVHSLRAGKRVKSSNHLMLSAVLGLVFVLIKGVEYNQKLNLGYGLSYDTFYMFYWLLTAFHLAHVVIGVVLLFVVRAGIVCNQYNAHNMDTVEATGVFWHMCDLIWVFLFPVLYLLH